MKTPERIAVIGVGRMGGGVARNLAAHFDVSVYDLDPAAIERCVAAGATGAHSAVDAIAGVDLVVSSLPMPQHLIELYDELAPHLGEDGPSIVMDTSTIDPDTAAKVAETVGRERFVACLLGKGPAQAETGDVPLFVGGPDNALDALGPVFECIGAGVHRLGTVEAAAAFKLVSNLLGMTNLAVLAEGYTLCRRAGVADDAFTAALADTGGWSYQAEVRLPWMIADDFEARFSVALGRKDLALTVAMAADWGIATPVGSAGATQLADAVAQGYGADDVAAVLKLVDSDRAPHRDTGRSMRSR